MKLRNSLQQSICKDTPASVNAQFAKKDSIPLTQHVRLGLDMYIAVVYSGTLATSCREGGRGAKDLAADMYVGHHTAYEKAMRVAAGFAPMEDMLAELDAEEDGLQFAMTAYGLCVLLEAHGETEKAAVLRKELLARAGFWFCFSYLAAYSDRKYTVKPATVT